MHWSKTKIIAVLVVVCLSAIFLYLLSRDTEDAQLGVPLDDEPCAACNTIGGSGDSAGKTTALKSILKKGGETRSNTKSVRFNL